MSKIEKPKYDFSFIKNISSHDSNYHGEKEGESYFSDLAELLDAFEHNYLATIKVLTIPLFEKGFKTFLLYKGKMNEFFSEDPNLTKMVLSVRYSDCQSYLRSYFPMNYDLLSELRNASNNKKHDVFEKLYNLNKKEILSLIFNFFILLSKNINGVEYEMPSEEFLIYYSSFETFKNDRINEVNQELNKEVTKAKRQKEKAKADLLSAIEEKENVDSTIKKSKEQLDIVASEIEKKEKELKELETRLSKRKTDLSLNVASMANNDLFDLASNLISKGDFEDAKRVFNNILNINIQDLRGYIGLILCLYKACDIDSLIDRAITTRIHLVNSSIYLDCQKFLKNEDKAFIEDIASTIENEIAFVELKEASKVNDFETMKSKILFLETSNCYYNLTEYKEFAEFEPLYLHSKNLYINHHFDEAIKTINLIVPYKDSEKLSKKWVKDKESFVKAEEKRLNELAEREKKEKEENEKREKERLEREKEIEKQRKIDDADADLEYHRFDDAIRKYNALALYSKANKARECKNLFAKFKEFERGEITYEAYLKIRGECSSEVVRNAELYGKSIIVINEEQTVSRLLKTGTYKDFLEAYLLLSSKYVSWRIYTSNHLDEMFDKIIHNGISKEIVKSLYIDNEIPEAKEQVEKYIQKHVYVPINHEAKKEIIDYILKNVSSDNKIFEMANNVKRNTIENDMYYAIAHHGNYQEAIKLYDPDYSTDESKYRYIFSLIKLSKKESLKKENLFTNPIGRRALITYLDGLKKEKNPINAEICFLRFLLDVYCDTVFYKLLQQIIYISYSFELFDRDNTSKYYDLFNKGEKRLEVHDEYDVLSICKHINNATQLINDINPINDSLLDFVSLGILEDEKRAYKDKYDKMVKKNKIKLAIFLMCSLLLPAGIVMSIFGFLGSPILGIFGVFAILFGFMFLYIFFDERGDVELDAISYFQNNRVYSRVSLINSKIVFSLDVDMIESSIRKGESYSFYEKFVLDVSFEKSCH